MRKIIFICLFCIFTLGTGMCACAEISANPIDPNKPFALTETEWLSLRESELGFLWQTEGLQDDNTSGLLKMSTFVESNNKFYYVDQENHTVNSIEFDGSNPQVLVNENDYIEGIIVTEQYLYVKYGYEYTRLVQYSLDGQDGCLLVAAETIDSLYFCNGMLYFLVGSSDTFCGAIKKESEAVPMGVGEIEILDSQEDAIYYMDHNGDLKRMNMDGTDQEILVSGGPYGFWIGIWDDKAHSFYDEKEWDSEIKFLTYDYISGDTEEQNIELVGEIRKTDMDFASPSGEGPALNCDDKYFLYEDDGGIWSFDKNSKKSTLAVPDDDTLHGLWRIEGATRPYYLREDGLYYVNLENGQEEFLFKIDLLEKMGLSSIDLFV